MSDLTSLVCIKSRAWNFFFCPPYLLCFSVFSWNPTNETTAFTSSAFISADPISSSSAWFKTSKKTSLPFLSQSKLKAPWTQTSFSEGNNAFNISFRLIGPSFLLVKVKEFSQNSSEHWLGFPFVPC